MPVLLLQNNWESLRVFHLLAWRLWRLLLPLVSTMSLSPILLNSPISLLLSRMNRRIGAVVLLLHSTLDILSTSFFLPWGTFSAMLGSI